MNQKKPLSPAVGAGLAILLVSAVLAGCSEDRESVAVLFVGHGEPAVSTEGDVAVTFADGSPFGPHGVELGVPAEYQYTEWAAAYEEIATAMTYMFTDVNGNGVEHEILVSPEGDVPPFFTWDAFHEEVGRIYDGFGGYSPHNDLITEHVENLEIDVAGARVDTFLAFLDAVPRIPDVMWDLTTNHDYDKVVLVPLLLADSTHTEEVADQVADVADMTGGMALAVAEPFYGVPFMRERISAAVVSMADSLRESVPAGVPDSDIGVLLVGHGTPYVPPYAEFGWEEGEIFSNLLPTEDGFHEEVAADLRWPVKTARMNYAPPTIEESLAAFEADGIGHVIVVPSAFPTAAMHTMWDVANPVIGRAVTPDEGVVAHTRASGMTVYYTAQGYADFETGGREFEAGLAFIAEIGVLQLLEAESGASG